MDASSQVFSCPRMVPPEADASRFVGACDSNEREAKIEPRHKKELYITMYYQYGGFLKLGYPLIIHFNGIFPYEPSILRYHHFRKPPYISPTNHEESTRWKNIVKKRIQETTILTRKKVSARQQNLAKNNHEEHLSNSRNMHQTIKTCPLQANMFCAVVEPWHRNKSNPGCTRNQMPIRPSKKALHARFISTAPDMLIAFFIQGP